MSVLGNIAGILYKKAAPIASEFRGIWVKTLSDDNPSTQDSAPLYYDFQSNTWKPLKGKDGANGHSHYVYRAYANTSTGGGFTNVFDSTKPYVAWLISSTEITTPTASDFTGLWELRGSNGVNGTSNFIYQAWADDAFGVGFTVAPVPGKRYSAFIILPDQVPPASLTSSQFANRWLEIKGEKGVKGDPGATITSVVWSGNDLEFIKSSGSPVVLVNAAVTLKGPQGDGATSIPVAFTTSLQFDQWKQMDHVQAGGIGFTLNNASFTPGCEITILIEQNGAPIAFANEFVNVNQTMPNQSAGDKCLIEFKAFSLSPDRVFYKVFNL